ncbi:MAG: bacteriohemerythrin [Treponema sp.]|nr:bacteriohemerythrin [Treponema sp.]
MTNENPKHEVEIVVWDHKYATEIELIDVQHKQLVKLTNQLYNACHEKDDVLQAVFKETMSRMVKYVHFHFDAELILLKALNYPGYNEHKKLHADLIKEILSSVNEYNEGKKLVPNHFVRTLKDWVFSHIAIYDKQYSGFVKEQIRNGLLTEKSLKDIEMDILQSFKAETGEK